MTQKEILRKVISSMETELRLFDFVASFKDQGFIRNTEDSTFFFQLLIYNRTIIKTSVKGFLIEPFIWVNVKEVETYYKEITLNKYLQRDINFVTLGNSLADLLANSDGIYKTRNNSLDLLIFNDSDVYYVTEQLIKKFKEVALPYCLQNSSVAAVDTLANTRPQEYKVNLVNDNYRIVKGIIAAKLNGNPRLEDLIKIYNRQLVERNMPDDTKEEMRRLKEILPTMK